MGLSRTPLLLLVGNLLTLAPQLGHDAAQEGRGIVKAAQHIHKATIIEAKACKVLNLIYGRKFFNEPIIHRAQFIHDGVFLAGRLYPAHDLVTFLPVLKKDRNQFYRVLKICAHQDRAIACGLTQAIKRAVELTKVFHIENGLCRLSCAQISRRYARVLSVLMLSINRIS